MPDIRIRSKTYWDTWTVLNGSVQAAGLRHLRHLPFRRRRSLGVLQGRGGRAPVRPSAPFGAPMLVPAGPPMRGVRTGYDGGCMVNRLEVCLRPDTTGSYPDGRGRRVYPTEVPRDGILSDGPQEDVRTLIRASPADDVYIRTSDGDPCSGTFRAVRSRFVVSTNNPSQPETMPFTAWSMACSFVKAFSGN